VELFSAFCMTLHLWMPFIAKLLISQEWVSQEWV
jgi:hypothetical protein